MEQSVSHLCRGVVGGPSLEEYRHHTGVAKVGRYDQRSVSTLRRDWRLRANLINDTQWWLMYYVRETVLTIFHPCSWHVNYLISPVHVAFSHAFQGSMHPCTCIWFDVSRLLTKWKFSNAFKKNLLLNSDSCSETEHVSSLISWININAHL